MVFEFVEKGSILEIPTDKPLDEDTAWSYFRDTLCGLEYCKSGLSTIEYTFNRLKAHRKVLR